MLSRSPLRAGFFASIATSSVSASAAFLFVSNAMPVASGLLAEGRIRTGKGPLRLGLWSKPCALLAIVGACVLAYVGIQPPNERVLHVLVCFIFALLFIWYVLGVRKTFAGPTSLKSEANLARIHEIEADINRTV